jgi:hypothetical protein
MRVLKTLFGDIIEVSPQDREEVKQLHEMLDEEEANSLSLAEKVRRLEVCVDCLLAQNEKLNQELSNTIKELRFKERYIETMKDLIRNIVD